MNQQKLDQNKSAYAAALKTLLSKPTTLAVYCEVCPEEIAADIYEFLLAPAGW